MARDNQGFRKETHDEMRRQADAYAHAHTIITEQHRLVHDGMMFHVSKKKTGLINTGVADLLVVVPAGSFPHSQGMQLTFGRGDVDIQVYEGTTTSADGTLITPGNVNRNSTKTPETNIYDTPTVTGVGTLIHTVWTPPTSTGTGLSAAGIITDATGEEWVLAPSTKYLIRITNNSGVTIDWSLMSTWYELTY